MKATKIYSLGRRHAAQKTRSFFTLGSEKERKEEKKKKKKRKKLELNFNQWIQRLKFMKV
jgi:hypothetical protein